MAEELILLRVISRPDDTAHELPIGLLQAVENNMRRDDLIVDINITQNCSLADSSS